MLIKTIYFFIRPSSLILAFAILLSSCSSQANEPRVHITDRYEIASLLDQINNHYYSLSGREVKSIILYCESEFIKALTSKAKDAEMKSYLSNVKFLVEWNKGEDFKVKVDGVPELGESDNHKGLSQIFSGTEKVMLGSFKIMLPAFDGIYSGSMDRTLNFTKGKKFTIMTLDRSPEKGVEEFYFDQNYKLLKGLLVIDGKVIFEAQYEVVNGERGYHLKKVRIFYPETNGGMALNVDYEKFNGYSIPAKFEGFFIKNGKEHSLPESNFRVIKADIKS